GGDAPPFHLPARRRRLHLGVIPDLGPALTPVKAPGEAVSRRRPRPPVPPLHQPGPPHHPGRSPRRRPPAPGRRRRSRPAGSGPPPAAVPRPGRAPPPPPG